MAISKSMLWPIERHSFIARWNMKCNSYFGMTVGILFLIHLICILLFLSHIMNPHSFKMTKEQPIGTIKTAGSL